MCRLEKDPGTIALLDGADLELLAQMDTKETMTRFPRFSTPFLCQLQVRITLSSPILAQCIP